MKTKTIRAISLLLLATHMASVAQALTIDAFNRNQKANSSTSATTTTNAITTATAVGGYRTLSIRKTTSGSVAASLQTADGTLFLSQGPGVAAQSSVNWDGDNDTTSINYTGLGGIDLTQDGASAILIHLTSSDNDIEFAIKIYDISDPDGRRYSMGSKITTSTAEQWLLLPFSELTDHGFTGAADLRSVGAIELLINGNAPGLDAAIDWIGTNGKCSEVAQVGAQIAFDMSADLADLTAQLKAQYIEIQAVISKARRKNRPAADIARRDAKRYYARLVSALAQFQPYMFQCAQSTSCTQSTLNKQLTAQCQDNAYKLYQVTSSMLKLLYAPGSSPLASKTKAARSIYRAQTRTIKKIPTITTVCP